MGYEHLLSIVDDEPLGRLKFMHEIWRVMPENFYANLFDAVGVELLGATVVTR